MRNADRKAALEQTVGAPPAAPSPVDELVAEVLDLRARKAFDAAVPQIAAALALDEEDVRAFAEKYGPDVVREVVKRIGAKS